MFIIAWLMVLFTILMVRAEPVPVTLRSNGSVCALDVPGATITLAANTTINLSQSLLVNATCPVQVVDVIETNARLASIEKNLSLLNTTCTLSPHITINGTRDMLADRLAESFEKQRSFYIENVKPSADRSTQLEVNFTDCVSGMGDAKARANATATELDKCVQLHQLISEERNSYRIAFFSTVGLFIVAAMTWAGFAFRGRIGMTKDNV